MSYATCRLEGRALEESLRAELIGGVRDFNGIRMKRADGEWHVVGPSEDGRVGAIMMRMAVIAGEVSAAVQEAGWAFKRADQLCELTDVLRSGEKHSTDLVIARGRRVVYVEVKWSPTAIARARSAGEGVLGERTCAE